MRTDRLILFLIVTTLALSGVVAWNLWAGTDGHEEFGFYRAQIQQDREMLQELQSSSVVERRIPAAPISQGGALSGTTAPERGKVLYYDPENGHVFRVDYNGSNRETISETRLSGLVRTLWSPTKQEVISEFASSRGRSFRHFDYVTKKTTTLPSTVVDVSFSPEGDRIAYFFRNDQEAGVAIAEPDGSSGKKILNTRVQGMDVTWIDERTIALIRIDPLSSARELYLLDTQGGLSKIYEPRDGLETHWAPDGSHALISYFDDDNVLRLELFKKSTQEVTSLDVPARASHCVMNARVTLVVCAVPQTPLSTAAIETQSKIPEDFYEIDLTSKEKKMLFSSGSRTARAAVSEIFLSPNEEYVFYINRFDEKLYSFRR